MKVHTDTRKTILLYLYKKQDVEYHEMKQVIKTEFIDNGADYCKTAHAISAMVKEGLLEPQDKFEAYRIVCTSSGGKPTIDPRGVSFMLKITNYGRKEVEATYLKESETKEGKLNRKWPITSQILVAVIAAIIIFLAGRLTALSDNQATQKDTQQETP